MGEDRLVQGKLYLLRVASPTAVKDRSALPFLLHEAVLLSASQAGGAFVPSSFLLRLTLGLPPQNHPSPARSASGNYGATSPL